MGNLKGLHLLNKGMNCSQKRFEITNLINIDDKQQNKHGRTNAANIIFLKVTSFCSKILPATI